MLTYPMISPLELFILLLMEMTYISLCSSFMGLPSKYFIENVPNVVPATAVLQLTHGVAPFGGNATPAYNQLDFNCCLMQLIISYCI